MLRSWPSFFGLNATFDAVRAERLIVLAEINICRCRASLVGILRASGMI
jgi:hypothetical protein